MQTRKFAVVLEPEEEGGFTVRVPSLPEIVTYGKDEAEALAMAEDAIRLVLQDTLARGDPLPNGEPPRIREVIVTLAARTSGYRRSERGMLSVRWNEPALQSPGFRAAIAG